MDRNNTTITALISGCCKNDRHCQRDLYHAMHGYAMKICYRYVNKMEEAEELVNESFIKLFRNIGQFDDRRQADTEALLKGWFKKIVVNTCIDYLRKSHLKLVSRETVPEVESFSDIQENGLDRLSYREIIEAIRKLTPVYRTVFNLFVIEGLTHEEIAEQLGISVGASKSNLSKARHNLRKIIMQQTDYKVYVPS